MWYFEKLSWHPQGDCSEACHYTQVSPHWEGPQHVVLREVVMASPRGLFRGVSLYPGKSSLRGPSARGTSRSCHGIHRGDCSEACHYTQVSPHWEGPQHVVLREVVMASPRGLFRGVSLYPGKSSLRGPSARGTSRSCHGIRRGTVQRRVTTPR